MKRLLLLFFILSLDSHDLLAQIQPTLKFRRYGIEDGLSQVTAKCLLEDKYEGYIWIGTQDGLNRFDGYQFKIFKHRTDDPKSLSSNRINAMCQDKEGNIWIGTSNGLNMFHPKKETFAHYPHDESNPNTLSHPNVTSVAQDKDGNLWIGTENGLNFLDRAQQSVTRFFSSPERPNTLTSNRISSVQIDNQGVIWIGTNAGLTRYDPKANAFSRYRHEKGNAQSLSSDEILSMFLDKENRLWIGTVSGLNLFDTKTGQVRFCFLANNDIRTISQDARGKIWVGTRWEGIKILDLSTHDIQTVLNEPDNPNSLSNNTVLSIIRDSRDNMWIGVSGMGFNIYNPRTSRFEHYKHKANDNYSLLDDEVWSILKDHKDQLWIATYAGISIIEKDGTISHIKNDPKNTSSLSSDQVTIIYQDKQRRIWIGTIYGLNLYHPESGTFSSFQNIERDQTSLSHNLIRSIFQDSKGRIWVGTEEGSLNQFDPFTNTFKRYAFHGLNQYATSHAHIKCITEDRQGQLWIGTDRGVNVLNPVTETFRYYLHEDGNAQSLSSNSVRCIAEDPSGNIWIGTDGGLNLFNRNSGSFRHWSEKDGLSNDVIYGILIDNQQHLWLSTNKGLNAFDPSTETFTVYNQTDGLQSDEFNTAAYFKDRNGFMYFGGPNGFNRFHPDSIGNDGYIAPVVFTDFLLFNESISILDGSLLAQSLNHTPALELQHDDDIFAFEFAALNYEQPEKIAYAYKLEPFHKDWIFTDYKDRKASFTRIPPGDYTLLVRASSRNDDWNGLSKSIAIRVIPPWYQTWWAKVLFVLLGLMLVILIILIRERNSRIVRLALEKMVAEKTSQLKIEKEEVSKQLAEKEILMREVHHRVKNNLTFLKSLLYLRAKASPDQDVQVILNECQARIETMAIVHQVLYDRDVSSVDITAFLKELFIQLQAIFRQENIDIDLRVNVARMHVDVNRSITIGLIINELITNSFKYAFKPSETGKITIEVSEEASRFNLLYSDSGPGMPVNYDFANSKGFGFRLISILINQINAEFTYSNSDNTFQFSIPK